MELKLKNNAFVTLRKVEVATTKGENTMTIKRQPRIIDNMAEKQPLVYQDDFCDCRKVTEDLYLIHCFDEDGFHWASCTCDKDGDMVDSCEDLGYIAADAPKDFRARLENYDWEALREAVQKDCEKRKEENA